MSVRIPIKMKEIKANNKGVCQRFLGHKGNAAKKRLDAIIANTRRRGGHRHNHHEKLKC